MYFLLVDEQSGCTVRLKYLACSTATCTIREGFLELDGGRRLVMSERGVGLPATLGHKPYGTVIAAGPALWVLNASFVDVDNAKLGAAATAGTAAR